MKEIKLSQDKFAKVDDEDYDFLSQWKWSAIKRPHTYYAVRTEKINDKTVTIRMHRVIMKTIKGMECDHEDHDGLNCQKYNLRNCTRKQNGKNRLAQKNCTSKYLGVTLTKSGTWQVAYRYNGKWKYLCREKNEVVAALKYNTAAKEHYGEFANLNCVPIPTIPIKQFISHDFRAIM